MSDQPEVGALHVIVHGVVQGVGFRYFVLRRAQPLGLTGWVRNLPDGTVEIRAEGPVSKLQELLAALPYGPYGAHVDRVEHLAVAPTGEFTDFLIR